jgi:hypothetical protein
MIIDTTLYKNYVSTYHTNCVKKVYNNRNNYKFKAIDF